jgi:thiamine-phosphate pyrophosphorylase
MYNGLYLISNTSFNQQHLGVLEELFQNTKIEMFQLRLKDKNISYIEEIAKKTQELCSKYNVKFIINDYIDLALKINLDGIHIGASDVGLDITHKKITKYEKHHGRISSEIKDLTKSQPISKMSCNQDKILQIKNLIKNGKIVGVSCYDKIDLALSFALEGVSYVSFGAFFKTQTKKTFAKPNIEIISEYKKYEKILNIKSDICVIGGLDKKNITNICKEKPNMICVVSAVWGKKNTKEMINEINRINYKINRYKNYEKQ